MKKLLILLVLAGLVTGGVFVYRRNGATAEASAPQYITAKVARGSIVQSVQSTGRVIANRDIDIKCKASGRIIRLDFDISDHVTTGDLLLELDPVDEKRALEQADVRLKSAEARLAQTRDSLAIASSTLQTDTKRAQAALGSVTVKARDARARAERMRQLLAKELASREDCDAAETSAIQAETELLNAQIKMDELATQKTSLKLREQDVKLAQADLENDKIARSISQQRYDDTRVDAPIEGVVALRSVQIGQIIASGISNVGGGTSIMTLSDISRKFVYASVDESEIGKIKVGDAAIVTVDAHAGIPFRGNVVRIATRGVNTQNVVTFEVRIEVRDPRILLKPEMTANVEIVAAEREDVLTLPMSAISYRRGRPNVLVKNDNGTSEPRPIEIGIDDGYMTEIVSGVEEGQTIVAMRGQEESRWRGGGPPRGAAGMMMMGGGGPPRGMRGGGGGGGPRR